MGKSNKRVTVRNVDQDKLLVLLEEVQDKNGYLSYNLLEEIAQNLNLPISSVYGVATFYSFLSIKPLGRNIIRVCKSLPCYLKNAIPIIDCITKELGIVPGETTTDGRFSFQLANCIGTCDRAPAMMINHDIHGNLTPKKISEILMGYK